MMKILAIPWELLKWLFGLAFPMFRGGGSATAGSPGTWVARGALSAVVLAGLYSLNQWETLGLRNVVPGRIGAYWLPLFAFCLYAMLWLGWWLYRLLSLEVAPVASEYPDIDRAWSQALEALGRADIHLDATPLFLVLGGTSSGEEALFRATAIKAQVKQVPKDPAEPLHVTANRDGIWVTCPGASILGQQLLAGDGRDGGGTEVTLSTLSEPTGDTSAFGTMGAGGGETIGVDDLRALIMKDHEEAQPHRPRRARVVVDSEKYGARLRYLCHLIARDRHGFCPINGVLVVLPITAAAPGNSVSEIAWACRTDLAHAFDVFRMRCPVLALVSDLDKLPGFTELVERLPSGQVHKGIGQKFSLVPELDADEIPDRIRDSVSWVNSTLFPSMVYSLVQTEAPGGEGVEEVVRANSQLYRFVTQIRDLRERLSQLVKDCIPTLPGQPIFFRGCYFAGTGMELGTTQAFASGIPTRLIKQQDDVTWTTDTLLQDASFARLARRLKIFFLCVIALGVALVLALIVRRVWL
jgi:type VI protein secretion system component VasK